MSVRSEISCFILYKDVIEFSWTPSGVVVSLIDQLQDLDITHEPNWKIKDYRESKASDSTQKLKIVRRVNNLSKHCLQIFEISILSSRKFY